MPVTPSSAAPSRGRPAQPSRGPQVTTAVIGARGPYRLVTLAGMCLLVVAPLVVVPGLSDGQLLAKAAGYALGAALLLTRRSAWRLDRAVSAAVAAGIAVLMLAAAGSAVPWLAWWGRYPRYEGAWVIALYVLCLLAGTRLAGHGRDLGAVLTRLVPGAAWVVLAVALAQLAQPGSAREGSLLGNATDLGAWGAAVAAGSLAAVWSGLTAPGWPRRWVLSGALAAAGSVLVSGSRTSVIAAVAAIVLAGILTRPGRRTVGWTTVTAVALVLSGLLAGVSGASRALAGAAGGDTVAGRWLLWSDTLTLVRAHLGLGVGPSGFVDAIGAAHSAAWAGTVGPVNPPDSPHLLLLQVATSAGLLGVAVGLAVLVVLIRAVRAPLASRRLESSVALTVVVGYLVAVSTEFTSPVLTPAAAATLGWLCARQLSATPRWFSVLPAASASVLALVLAAAVVAEAHVSSALSDLSHGDASSASAAFTAARTWAPWNQDLRLREGHAFSAAAQAGLVPFSSCLAPTHETSTILVGSSEAALDDGLCREGAGDLGGAARVLAAARAHDPTNLNLLLAAGVVAAEKGSPDQAVDLLSHAAALAPADPEPWTDLAVVYSQQGRTALADGARATATRLTTGRASRR